MLKNYDEKQINDAISDLLQVFNSKITDHITYVLTGVIAFFSVLQIKDIPNLIFLIILSVFVVGEAYFIIRALMWTKYANIVIQVKPKEIENLGLHHRLLLAAEEKFKKENKIIARIALIEIRQRIPLLFCIVFAIILLMYYSTFVYSLFEIYFPQIIVLCFVVSAILLLCARDC